MGNRRYFPVKLLLLICSAESMNVFQPKHFCGSVLADTLKKYNCIYHEIKSIDQVVYGSGIVKDCCFNRCSEYDLLKNYCSHSDLDSIAKELLTTPRTNEIVPETFGLSDDEPNDIGHQKPTTRKRQRNTLLTQVSGKKNKDRRKRKPKRGKTRVSFTNNKKLKISPNRRRSCLCSCFKPGGATNNKEVILKSPVVGLTNFSRNSVIRLASVDHVNFLHL